jgi:hypothetical protein
MAPSWPLRELQEQSQLLKRYWNFFNKDPTKNVYLVITGDFQNWWNTFITKDAAQPDQIEGFFNGASGSHLKTRFWSSSTATVRWN